MRSSEKILGLQFNMHLLMVLILVFSLGIQGELTVYQTHWRDCIGQKQLSVFITSFNKISSGETQRVFNVSTTTFAYTSDAIVDNSFCSLEDNPDACSQESVKEYELTCPKILLKMKPWTNFINSFEPKIECPFKKGTYTSKGPDSDVWKMFASGLKETKSGTYQVHFEVTDSDYGPFLCWDMEFEVKI